MPEAKKRHSPVPGHNKPSKHVISSEHQQPTTPDIIEEIQSVPTNKAIPPSEQTAPQPAPPVDIMKNEPVLLPIVVETFTGDLDENGFYHGQGAAILKGGLKYNGSFNRGKMHGEGTLVWPNRTTFTGSLNQNEITGKGRK